MTEQNDASMPDLKVFIDREIVERLAKNVSWNKLDSCFKWQRVMEHLEGMGVTADDPRIQDVRSLLKKGLLVDVDYDAVEKKVLRLGHGFTASG